MPSRHGDVPLSRGAPTNRLHHNNNNIIIIIIIFRLFIQMTRAI